MLSQLPEDEDVGETAAQLALRPSIYMREYAPFFSSTQPANPSSMSHRKTLDMPPSKYLRPSAPSTTPSPHVHSQLSVHIKRLVRLDLHLPYAITRRDALLNRRLELVAPRTPPAISIAVIIAAQKVALRLCAFLDGERDVNRLEQVFLERGVEGYDVVDVALDVLGVEPAQEVAGRLAGAMAEEGRGGDYRALSMGSAMLCWMYEAASGL
jgi:hypothetical protein